MAGEPVYTGFTRYGSRYEGAVSGETPMQSGMPIQTTSGGQAYSPADLGNQGGGRSVNTQPIEVAQGTELAAGASYKSAATGTTYSNVQGQAQVTTVQTTSSSASASCKRYSHAATKSS